MYSYHVPIWLLGSLFWGPLSIAFTPVGSGGSRVDICRERLRRRDYDAASEGRSRNSWCKAMRESWVPRTGSAAISDRGLPFLLPQDPQRATTGRRRHCAGEGHGSQGRMHANKRKMQTLAECPAVGSGVPDLPHAVEKLSQDRESTEALGLRAVLTS